MTKSLLQVGSQGLVLITGLTEPVVKAYSLITDLVEKYKSSQGRRSEAGLESLESRRAFKAIVESLEDRHTLDLLVLPVLVKEVLLDLVKQSGLDSHAMRAREGPVPVIGNGSWAMQRTADEIAFEGSGGSNQNAENLHSLQPRLFPQSSHRINGTDAFNSKSYDPFSRGSLLTQHPLRSQSLQNQVLHKKPNRRHRRTPSCCLRGAEKILTTLSSSSPPWDLSIMWCKPFLTELAPKKPRNFWI